MSPSLARPTFNLVRSTNADNAGAAFSAPAPVGILSLTGNVVVPALVPFQLPTSIARVPSPRRPSPRRPSPRRPSPTRARSRTPRRRSTRRPSPPSPSPRRPTLTRTRSRSRTPTRRRSPILYDNNSFPDNNGNT